jgi:4-amino-4-deoxy-L-arabinose transferase-like glycosyltransferase
MDGIPEAQNQKPTRLTWVFLALTFLLFAPAYLVNLGVVPLIEDECIRATVAMEMNINNDYLTPTIGGEAYLKKPPLYNWILAGLFKLTGSQSEFVIRIPVTIAVILLSLIIYFFVRSETNRKLALAAAIGFATCGRILFYESQHGLIDVTYSIVVFLNFIFVYKMGKKGNILLLFLGSYALTAFGFLFKGLPSLVFQGFTLIAWFAYSKDLKKLFSYQHLLGVLVFIVPVLIYYVAYFIHNKDITVTQMVSIMLGESTRRTGIRFGAARTIGHLVSFPFEVIYHYLPWTLFVILLFIKGNLKKIMQHDLLRYGLFIIGLNIIPYWSSPEVFARYYIMLMPFVFLIFFYLYFQEEAGRQPARKVLDTTLLLLAILVSLIPFGYLFMERFEVIPHHNLKIILLLAALFILTGLLQTRKDRLERLFVIFLLLLVSRVGVNWFLLPVKALESDRLTYKKETIRAAKASGSLPVVRYWPPEIKATGYYGHRSTSYLTIFYMTREKHQIVPYSTLPPDDNCLYLVRYMDLARLKLPYERICGVHYDRNYPPINLVRFKLPQDTTGVQ